MTQSARHGQSIAPIVQNVAVAVALVAMGMPSASRADDSGDKRALSFSAGGSYTTHKSKLQESNDTGFSYEYGLRVLGGASKSVLAEVRGGASSTTFSLVSGTMATQDLLVLFGYAFEYGYIAAGGGTRQLKAKTTALELDTFSRTYGGALGFDFGLMRGVKMFTDISATMPLETKEAEQIPVTMGLAMSAQSGLRFDLTRRALDLAMGVRYSSLAVSSSGAGGGETFTAPFLSLQWGLDL